MTLPDCQELLLDIDDGILNVTLNRPHKRNAMNSGLVSEIMAAVESVQDDSTIRAIIFRGTEGNFCSGGDISGMNTGQMDEDDAAEATWEFNRAFGRMVTLVNRAPQIIVAALEGAVMGGGLGLACISDVAIADKNAMFSMPETGLGIIPAQIAPFVVARIGLTQARRLALLGDRVDGEEAVRLGIAHYLTHTNEELEVQLEKVKARIYSRAPNATAATKRLLFDVGVVEHEALLDAAADAFTKALRSKEGQEGTSAFLNKRKPYWAKPDDEE
ncbi:MAG: enoyl-CoA hydratase/isomerase family protein [Gammaproteobacteria bacterium]|nr:enoyl-CoA hydratase/isomerase family protein [Gammaproteobacteria bacterium]MDH3578754.1 enoyl-CoA hydratase/isomerase family protein [Gammaproteobacteria bacterium]